MIFKILLSISHPCVFGNRSKQKLCSLGLEITSMLCINNRLFINDDTSPRFEFNVGYRTLLVIGIEAFSLY